MSRRDSIIVAVNHARGEAESALRALPHLAIGASLSELEYRDALYEAERLMLAGVKLNRHLATLAALDGQGDA